MKECRSVQLVEPWVSSQEVQGSSSLAESVVFHFISFDLSIHHVWTPLSRAFALFDILMLLAPLRKSYLLSWVVSGGVSQDA